MDPHYGLPSTKLWSETGLDIRLEDFTRAEPPESAERFNLLICNPPYVRHHHIANGAKQRLKLRSWCASCMEINGLAGPHCHFLGLSHAWMADGGLAGWLIPGEFMDVNYGASVRRYLIEKVKLVHIHRFDPRSLPMESDNHRIPGDLRHLLPGGVIPRLEPCCWKPRWSAATPGKTEVVLAGGGVN